MSATRSPKAKAAPLSSSSVPVSADVPSRQTGKFPVVGIGASAGGLDACKKLLAAMPANSGMAFILIQHLEPTHESMMVELLASHTSLTVEQATEGTLVQRNHLYIIPPGAYLSVSSGALHLSKPGAPHGLRLPFDFLLFSLAKDIGAQAICIVLSGTGADGSLGLKAVHEKKGFVIAQNPDEAAYDGMPRSAIATGVVDQVLAVDNIPDALQKHTERGAQADMDDESAFPNTAKAHLPEIIDLLRANTAHDFTLYKAGTLQRRTERRMALCGLKVGDVYGYLERLRRDPNEIELLSTDLLINVTSFFRDPDVFAFLAAKIIPGLVSNQPAGQPLRIWIAGCSTGEETYSLAMMFREAISATKSDVKLQVFASDADPHVVARAREGLYPETIASEVSEARLAQFFTKEDHSYRISSDLRAMVVFTVQDVLADPPFSRLDFVSCRNLLIYLKPEAQEKVLSLFHFALSEGGILLLGNSETVGAAEGRYKMIAKSERLYRRLGPNRQSDLRLAASPASGIPASRKREQIQGAVRPAILADLCRRLVAETYAPAAVLINRKSECLYSLGPTDHYLKVAPGHSNHDLLTMSREGVRAKLRMAIDRAVKENMRVVVTGGRMRRAGKTLPFSIAAQPVINDGEDLIFVCFIDDPGPVTVTGSLGDNAQIVELEHELDATKTELRAALHDIEVSGEEQKVINEEASSVSEEYQATNEELLTSKEELQSLNEELTALNSQLQETLERQRTTSNDLQNVLYSTDVATLFLDTSLNIRFFTPATKALFNLIPGDIGRPLADLSSLAADGTLPADAVMVLQTSAAIDREIEARSGSWYMRRILPYRAQDDGVEGVVITFTDITTRKADAEALESAKRQAQTADTAKSRFLAAASHDLRQPLQTLTLLQGLLEKSVKSESSRQLVARLDETLDSMSGMLNALLDINQIEAGTVGPEIGTFPINDLFERLKTEFAYHAQAQDLDLRVVPCRLSVTSDPHLLEQMIRNLLSNALKYTTAGKVLLGCRRHGMKLSIQIWDTGIGIPAAELQTIFEEYYQLDNDARERDRGLGLGLSIVQRLGGLLGHRVQVLSRTGKGSAFIIEVDLPIAGMKPPAKRRGRNGKDKGVPSQGVPGEILVIEDDLEVRQLLQQMLSEDGHHVVTASDGIVAQDLVSRGVARPDLVLADYNLPNGMNGLEAIGKLRGTLHAKLPAIILTGDIATGTLRDIAAQDCLQLNKPVKVKELVAAIRELVPISRKTPDVVVADDSSSEKPIVFVVDDDRLVRIAIRDVLQADGFAVQDFETCEAFLEAYQPVGPACLLVDAYLPGMIGVELLQRLQHADYELPAIMITGNSDVPMAVNAMKAGAFDFIEKPIGRVELLASVERALELARDAGKALAWRQSAIDHLASLTMRQRQIMDMVLAGHPSKNIASDLGISQRTVENHRASIMKKTGSKSLPALARLALAANHKEPDQASSGAQIASPNAA